MKLPPIGDRRQILAFASSFNGYEHHGSFEACADAAAKKDRNSLDALRNELFFSYRASNHRGDDGFVKTYEELFPLFQQYADEDDGSDLNSS